MQFLHFQDKSLTTYANMVETVLHFKNSEPKSSLFYDRTSPYPVNVATLEKDTLNARVVVDHPSLWEFLAVQLQSMKFYLLW